MWVWTRPAGTVHRLETATAKTRYNRVWDGLLHGE